ncbi:MAG: hypothetical protein HKM93_21110 [Desulfobacteraceae bacterium]|nr:hypothetical protein [Desulfobacteraceae bacterium]
MTSSDPFEKQWQRKFSDALESNADLPMRNTVITGSKDPAKSRSGPETAEWTQKAMVHLETLMTDAQIKEVMNDCACEYPERDILPLAAEYRKTGDIQAVHRLLCAQFKSYLEDALGLGADLTAQLLNSGWGVPGIIKGDTIIATKIPRSENIESYFAETGTDEKRKSYCHCPRVCHAIENGISISPLYCYCGGGFYRTLWERILDRPVRIRLLNSIIQGDDICRFEVSLK